MDKTKLPELFGGFPVVGMFLSNISNATTETSNQTIITLQVIASFGWKLINNLEQSLN